jgi:site-specific DNA-cytosine methylase
VAVAKPLWFTKSRRAQNVDDYETWVEGGVMPTLNAFDNGDIRSTVIIFYGNRVDDVRLQGGVINTLQARMGTGGNNMPMVAHAIQGTVIGRSDTAGPAGKGYGEADDPMFTIDTVGGHAVATENQVRRLTPLECERLQGFPDDWTASQSDSARYKQMGNAVAVPVVEWIIQGIVDTLI